MLSKLLYLLCQTKLWPIKCSNWDSFIANSLYIKIKKSYLGYTIHKGTNGEAGVKEEEEEEGSTDPNYFFVMIV